ncbi:zonadhesin-like [Alligator sinensis]|uniref:Zonadhesin-like n=1 Tax=Alligator sinensis TaxID=38654 RepID=A0A3Q0FJ42_ALLSI|nr:zonadhesin-like [Alligator sinensis]
MMKPWVFLALAGVTCSLVVGRTTLIPAESDSPSAPTTTTMPPTSTAASTSTLSTSTAAPASTLSTSTAASTSTLSTSTGCVPWTPCPGKPRPSAARVRKAWKLWQFCCDTCVRHLTFPGCSRPRPQFPYNCSGPVTSQPSITQSSTFHPRHFWMRRRCARKCRPFYG